MRSKILFRIVGNSGDMGLTQSALEKTHIRAELLTVGNGEKTPDGLFGSCRFTNRDNCQMPSTGC